MGKLLAPTDYEGEKPAQLDEVVGLPHGPEIFFSICYCSVALPQRTEFFKSVEHSAKSANLSAVIRNVVFLSRAVTPPGRPKRFDTRFFICARDQFEAHTGVTDGELVELSWVTFKEALELPLHVMTRVILEDLND